MTELPDYLIKLSVGLAVAYIFYYAVLRRHTFYNWNRWYLLLYSMAAFLVPFVEISTFIPEQRLAEYHFINQVPQLSHLVQNVPIANALPDAVPQDPVNWLLIFFVTGIICMTGRFCLHIYFYIRIKRKARLISEDDVSLYHVDREIAPFSFGNAIFINPSMHSEDELEKIILHEYVHVRQKHTFDNIWAEILCILNWYNPFAWLIRYAIRQNLEYIADDQVLQHHVNAKQYQYLLLKVTGVPEYRITNQFNFASLKQRIIMMNKARTPKIHLVRFLFLVPLLTILLVAFRPDIEPLQRWTGNRIVSKHQNKFYTLEKSAHTKIKESLGYCAGFLMDARTQQPLADFPLNLIIDEKVVNTIYTDNDGYYFSKIELDSTHKDFVLFSIQSAYPEYADFTNTAISSQYSLGYGRLAVNFVRSKRDSTMRNIHYSPQDKLYPKDADYKVVKKDVKTYLSELLTGYTRDTQLRSDFRKFHPFPKNVLTKFRNGYFDRRKELVGYEGITELYLDGKRATHTDINEAFRSSPYMPDDTKMSREWGRDGIYSKISYITYELYKDAPPSWLMWSNAEVADPAEFDLAYLNQDAYFLDGFRQVAGIGSNLKPLKSEIRKVVLFKGRLARYYDPKLERMWWIETRPENEVFGRPDLAKQ
ncbi:M56 family metallopeptidase [Dyadobacter alkalitolerans]|uniref:M56 family metallopeptidase n=1 Tax=Dyadobacter alkalitolerans TaxID=492736 RepID=UPI00041F81ED|nr:M56 family metallopeptidase [Dyadobacter alkalitolerans]